MAGETSRCSSLQWTSVIEAIINVKEVDVTTLINVFKGSSKIVSDVESNAREMISFRILERLFDPDDRPIKSARCAQSSGVGFDYSKRCEDVLRDILGKMNDPNIWDESEKSKWNVKRFIEYKRRVMETRLERKTSYLTSLNQMVTSRKLNQDGSKICDVNGAVIDNQQKSPCIDDKVCQDTSNDRKRNTRTGTLNGENGDKVCQDISNERNKRTRVGDICDENGDKACRYTSNEGNRNPRTGLCSDDETYQKELNDIDAKKQVFFRSTCKKDKEGFTHQKDVNRCMKCKKGGQLLICSSYACSFVFHESCLVSSTPSNHDSSENFYCPFCKCSRSISDYWVAKKKTSLSRNHLAAFCGGDIKNIEWETLDMVLDPDLTNKSTEISGKEGCNERSPEKEKADVVDSSLKFQKPTNTDSSFSHKRRVPVPWTQSEEETLKKWVEKFLSLDNIQDKVFPWSKILKLGASTFQKSRIPVDLKDKWRNMQKASKKST